MTELDSLPDGTYTAVVDTIEDGFATVFFEEDGADIGNAILEVTMLPEGARHADAILSATIVDGEAVEWAYDPEQTEDRAEKAQNRFDRLSERPPSDDES